MHSEHLQNVRPTWVAFGWFAAAAVTGLVLVILISLGLVSPDHAGDEWMIPAIVVGFFSGGWLVGWRTAEAPLLHGIGIGLFSLVAWLAINLLAAALDLSGWTALSPTLAAAVLLLQAVAAAAGAWYGARHHAVGV